MLQPASVDTRANDDAPPAPPAAAPAWSLSRRVAFRFVAALAVLWIVPFPLGRLPWTQWATPPFSRFFSALVGVAGRLLLHRTVALAPSGSSDQTSDWLNLGAMVVLALVAALVWSLVDHRRLQYVRASGWLDVYLRFFVGAEMLTYGFDKVFHAQFPFPATWKLEQPYGDASPMGLLWTFMGYSTPACSRRSG
jgi:hypothetical protein